MKKAIFSPVKSEYGTSKAWLVICWHFIQRKIENRSACATRNGCQDPLWTCSTLRRQMRKNSNPKNYLKVPGGHAICPRQKTHTCESKTGKTTEWMPRQFKSHRSVSHKEGYPVGQLLCNVPRKLHFHTFRITDVIWQHIWPELPKSPWVQKHSSFSSTLSSQVPEWLTISYWNPEFKSQAMPHSDG